MSRPDNFEMMELLTGKHTGQKALIILGGSSAANWQQIRDEIKPDILIGVNGVNGQINNLDYWLCIENMRHTFKLAKDGDARSLELLKMYRRTGAEWRIINYLSSYIIRNKINLICVKRFGVDDPDNPGEFSFRKYNGGLITGWIYDGEVKTYLDLRVGTVGLQALHLAGILGCSEIHTVGYDLCFKSDSEHHWYTYPSYESNYCFGPEMMTEYKGLKTLYWWIDTARYLKQIEPLLERDGITWIDHSDGLLRAEGLKCAFDPLLTKQYNDAMRED